MADIKASELKAAMKAGDSTALSTMLTKFIGDNGYAIVASYTPVEDGKPAPKEISTEHFNQTIALIHKNASHLETILGGPDKAYEVLAAQMNKSGQLPDIAKLPELFQEWQNGAGGEVLSYLKGKEAAVVSAIGSLDFSPIASQKLAYHSAELAKQIFSVPGNVSEDGKSNLIKLVEALKEGRNGFTAADLNAVLTGGFSAALEREGALKSFVSSLDLDHDKVVDAYAAWKPVAMKEGLLAGLQKLGLSEMAANKLYGAAREYIGGDTVNASSMKLRIKLDKGRKPDETEFAMDQEANDVVSGLFNVARGVKAAQTVGEVGDALSGAIKDYISR